MHVFALFEAEHGTGHFFTLSCKHKKAGIVLILRSEKDRKHLMRLRSLIAGKKLDIKVWVIEPMWLEQK